MSAYDLNNAPGFKRSENERRAARCVTHHHACDCRKAATDAEIERLAWNLAGCDVIANGGPIECDESMALPALSAVIKLRQERDRLRERVASLRHLHSVEANERFARTPPVSGVVLTQAIVATANAIDRCIACGALDGNGTAHGVGDSAAKAREDRA